MGKLLILLAITPFFLASLSYCLDLDSFLLGTLDDTRIALEATRKTSERTAVTNMKIKVTEMKKATRLGGWSRRRRAYASRRRFRPRPVPRKRAPINKHLQATNQIEKGIRDAGAMRHGQSVNKLKQQIQTACRSKQYVFARQMLGHTIFNFAKGEESRRRVKRSVTSPAKKIIDDIKQTIGDSQFDRLMALDGMVTLAFAIDTTGSMSSEISDAINLAITIAELPRTFEVDYILSPFNDRSTSSFVPIQHGPATYYAANETTRFYKMLRQLRARGGGDCEELTIEGIENIFSASVQYQSPIYVFTDAGAKDATPDNIEALKIMAEGYQTAINFFLSNVGCMNKRALDLFKSLADATGGQILYFHGNSALGTMSNFITKGLIGGTNIPVIQTGRTRRSLGSTEYTITVDNSMDTLSATVMTGTSGSNIQLRNPGGTLQVGGKTDTGKGSLFLVKKPTPGVWKLTVPPSRDGHFVTARGVSEENIDFEYFFIVESKIGGRKKQILTSTPLKGKPASVVVTVPAHGKTVPSSYKVHVVNNKYKLPIAVPVRQKGRSPGRYAGQFYPPSHDFKMILEGKTKEGRHFKRTCPGTVKASTALIHVFSAPRGFALTAGSRISTTILFAVNNYGPTERFDVKIKELKKYVQRYSKTVFVVSGRSSLFPVSFKAPSGAKTGSAYQVVVSIVGQRSKTRASMLVQLLVV